MNIINYIIGHSDNLLVIATTIVALASAIAALTPTPQDDGWARKAYKLVDWVAFNVGKAKDK